jgi:hypothetical protein
MFIFVVFRISSLVGRAVVLCVLLGWFSQIPIPFSNLTPLRKIRLFAVVAAHRFRLARIIEPLARVQVSLLVAAPSHNCAQINVTVGAGFSCFGSMRAQNWRRIAIQNHTNIYNPCQRSLKEGEVVGYTIIHSVLSWHATCSKCDIVKCFTVYVWCLLVSLKE